ncbi:MAG: site-2 protease family protein, partial [Desulfotomaculaceae bacterium]|nr:site-2 protease family protein [Desulfotomaculaceae bacterium]
MNGSIVIGKIREIEIEVHFSWLLIFALVTFMLATSYFPQFYPEWDPALMWVLGSLLAVLFFVSILLHELSHSLVSIDQGIPVKKITLFIFGGIAQIERDPDTPLKELKVAIAGPAMSVFLYVLFMSLAFTCDFLEISPAAVVSFNYIATANLVLAIFNLVPAFPLDGGRVLRAIIWHFKGDMQHATKIASSMGSIFGYFLMFNGAFLALAGNLFNGLWFIFIGWFLNQASRSSYQQIVFSDIFKKIHVSEFMTEKIMTV